MMQITFTFNSDLLLRGRNIQLTLPTQGTPYAIPTTLLYDPIYRFSQIYPLGFSFNLIALLHAASVKKLGYPVNDQRFLKRSLLVAGGLYLALNPRHRDLEIRAPLGDFISGFSHDLGVGLTLLLVSEMFDVPLDDLNPIAPKSKKKALDYAALIRSGQVLLQVEAKGITSTNKSSVRKDIIGKKNDSNNTVTLRSGAALTAPQSIKLGIIVQASYREKKSPGSASISTTGNKRRVARGSIEIIDPEPQPIQMRKEDILAGKYWHFAAVALFAGQEVVAKEFVQRAKALRSRHHRDIQLRNYVFDRDRAFSRFNRQFVGIQWQLSDLPLSTQDVWFYQAADINVLQNILNNEIFPQTHAYRSPDSQFPQKAIAENLFSDGSYFGIGLPQQRGLTSLISEDDGPEQQSLWES